MHARTRPNFLWRGSHRTANAPRTGRRQDDFRSLFCVQLPWLLMKVGTRTDPSRPHLMAYASMHVIRCLNSLRGLFHPLQPGLHFVTPYPLHEASPRSGEAVSRGESRDPSPAETPRLSPRPRATCSPPTIQARAQTFKHPVMMIFVIQASRDEVLNHPSLP